MSGLFIEDLSIGQKAELVKHVTATDVDGFAKISGDTNPVHLDEAYAEKTVFKTRIAHGMLSAGFISAVLGTKLPGEGAIYLSQNLKFKAPVKINDTVKTVVTVKEINAEKKRVTLETLCFVGDTMVVEGEALILVPSRA